MNIIDKSKAEYICQNNTLGVYKDKVFILRTGNVVTTLFPERLEAVKRGFMAVKWFKVKPINLENV